MKIYIPLKKRLDALMEKIYRAVFPMGHALQMQEIIDNRIDGLWRWKENVVDAETDPLVKQLMEHKFLIASHELYKIDETMLEREVRAVISEKVAALALRIKNIKEFKVAK